MHICVRKIVFVCLEQIPHSPIRLIWDILLYYTGSPSHNTFNSKIFPSVIHKTRKGLAATHLHSPISSKAPTSSINLRSTSALRLQLANGPRTSTRCGQQAFAVTAPTLGNNLPLSPSVKLQLAPLTHSILPQTSYLMYIMWRVLKHLHQTPYKCDLYHNFDYQNNVRYLQWFSCSDVPFDNFRWKVTKHDLGCLMKSHYVKWLIRLIVFICHKKKNKKKTGKQP